MSSLSAGFDSPGPSASYGLTLRIISEPLHVLGDGRIVYHSNKAINCFRPPQLHDPARPLTVRLSSIVINRQTPVYSKVIDQIDTISLRYTQNNITVSFFATNFSNAHATLYSYTFEDAFFLAGSFSNAEDFRKNIHRLTDLHVAVMDISLPGISGIQCIEALKPKYPKIQYLACTVFEDSTHLYKALCAGATGYILKSAGEKEIVQAILDIHAGGSPMSPQIVRMVVNSYPARKANTNLLNALNKLERELLDLPAAGYRYKEIAEKLFLSIETVRS